MFKLNFYNSYFFLTDYKEKKGYPRAVGSMLLVFSLLYGIYFSRSQKPLLRYG